MPHRQIVAMSLRHNLQSAALLSLLIFIAGVRSVEVSRWFHYPGSPEALASGNATLALARLPPRERTLAVAVNLCHQHSPSLSSDSDEHFCAWVAVNSSDGDRPVAVSCFNEWHRQCNRRSLTTSRPLSRYREAECNLCTPCSSGKWDACPECNRVCYCTCAHSRSSYNDGSSTKELFRCHEFCDGRSQCANGNDERSDMCGYYKLAGSQPPNDSVFTDTNTISLIGCIFVFICLSVGSLVWKYVTYNQALRRSQAPPSQPLVPVNLPAGSYPRQEAVELPPPPSYSAVAK